MRSGIPKILVTGGAGFIGSAFVRLLIKRSCSRHSPEKSSQRGLSLDNKVIVVDKLTYAGDLKRLDEIRGKYEFYKTDICNAEKIEYIFREEKPQIVVNFAAETHVDRSILDSSTFVQTNIIGTQVLLDASRKYKVKKFIHISTDEVYGEIKKGKFSEDSPLRPSSPYAASKAAADLLIMSYVRTYNFPAFIIRPCNNYGPWQYPEKLIPLTISKIFMNKKIPVYGDGRNIREWIFVDDCVEGIIKILERGKSGEVYNLGSQEEKQNIEVIRMILKILKRDKNMIEFIRDRPGHDARYSLNSSNVFNKMVWCPKLNFDHGLKVTILWCIKHGEWLLSKLNTVSPLYDALQLK